MAIRLKCQCGKRFAVPAIYAGRSGRCPHCHRVMSIPTSTLGTLTIATGDAGPALSAATPAANQNAREPSPPAHSAPAVPSGGVESPAGQPAVCVEHHDAGFRPNGAAACADAPTLAARVLATVEAAGLTDIAAVGMPGTDFPRNALQGLYDLPPHPDIELPTTLPAGIARPGLPSCHVVIDLHGAQFPAGQAVTKLLRLFVEELSSGLSSQFAVRLGAPPPGGMVLFIRVLRVEFEKKRGIALLPNFSATDAAILVEGHIGATGLFVPLKAEFHQHAAPVFGGRPSLLIAQTARGLAGEVVRRVQMATAPLNSEARTRLGRRPIRATVVHNRRSATS